MKRWSPARLLATVALSALLWAVIASACLLVGSSSWGWPQTWQFNERWPRVLQASLIGAALSAAGVVYQAILRNPLAEPYLLGVSSGASLASYLWQLPALSGVIASMGIVGAALGQQGFAFAGAMAAIAIVMTLSSRRGRLEPVTLVLVGVIVNIMLGAVFLLIDALVKTPAQGSIFNFLVGGIQDNVPEAHLVTAAACAGVGFVLLLYISGVLNAAHLSDVEATALGVRVQALRWVALAVASLMTASVVAVSGPIGFLGLICPHLARMTLGNDRRLLLPVATALGAATLALADAGSRVLSVSPHIGTVLPVGVITGIFGGPFFLLILWNSRRRAALMEAST